MLQVAGVRDKELWLQDSGVYWGPCRGRDRNLEAAAKRAQQIAKLESWELLWICFDRDQWWSVWRRMEPKGDVFETTQFVYSIGHRGFGLVSLIWVKQCQGRKRNPSNTRRMTRWSRWRPYWSNLWKGLGLFVLGVKNGLCALKSYTNPWSRWAKVWCRINDEKRLKRLKNRKKPKPFKKAWPLCKV